METKMQKHCLEICNKICEIRDQKDQLEEDLEKDARLLLDDLKKIDGWEILIHEDVKWHYDKFPDEFFSWCSVWFHQNKENETILCFEKGYSNGDEITALELNLSKPLEDQVNEKKAMLIEEEMKKKIKQNKNEYNTYLRLKKKFENIS